MGANTTGSATRKPTLVAVVRSRATLQHRYDTAMHSAWGSQVRTRTPCRRRAMRRPKKRANTAVASPKRTAKHHKGVMDS